MVSGFWLDPDGRPRNYGTSKAVPEVGGDYLVYGETREIEQLIPLVPLAFGTGGLQVPAAPTTFSGTGTPAQAGIQSMTTILPLQITPVTTVSGGVITFTTTQLFFEQIEVDTIIGATGGTSLSVGLAAVSPGSPSSSYVQVTPNAGVQLLNGMLIANFATSGQKSLFTQPGSTGILMSAAGTPIAGGGSWLGSVPLVTNALTPLPAKAYISSVATGAFTSGLIKLRIKYTMYGNISN